MFGNLLFIIQNLLKVVQKTKRLILVSRKYKYKLHVKNTNLFMKKYFL